MKPVSGFCSILIINLLLIIPLAMSAQNQSLIEQLEGVETSFKITWQENDLKLTDQAVFKRGLSRYKYGEEPVMEYGYGFGYGVETFRLEFMTNDSIEVIDSSYKRRFNYEIVLVDSDDSILLKTNVNRSDILKFSNGKNLNTISINLQSLPLIVLNKTSVIKISIVK